MLQGAHRPGGQLRKHQTEHGILGGTPTEWQSQETKRGRMKRSTEKKVGSVALELRTVWGANFRSSLV